MTQHTPNFSLQEIADLFERDFKEVEAGYQEWLADRRKYNQPLKPNTKLLAKLSGLSPASISNYLQNKPGLKEENRKRLEKLINLVGFIPSRSAQSLHKQHRNTIGIVLPLTSISPAFYLEILNGVKQKTSFFGLNQLIFDVTTLEERDDFFDKMPFLDMVDGLIVVSLFMKEDWLSKLAQAQVPVVMIHNRLTQPSVVANIFSYEETALHSLVEHLITDHGYQRLALVTLKPTNPLKMGNTQADWNRQARILAYQETLQRHGLAETGRIFEVQEHSFSEGARAFEQICQFNCDRPETEQIQAVVCTSDTLAAAVLVTSQQAGMPLAVTGYDNLALANLHNITTVDQKALKIGMTAVEQLTKALDYQRRRGILPTLEEMELGLEVIKTEPVIRTSCGCGADQSVT
jgi:LacI family transcriptional regulator